jgi:hypothetical protein
MNTLPKSDYKESVRTLYDLPKDILVKLLLTCENDAIKRYKKEMRNKKLNAFKCFECDSIYFLSHNWYFNSWEDTICEVCAQEREKTNNIYINIEKLLKEMKESENCDVILLAKLSSRDELFED